MYYYADKGLWSTGEINIIANEMYEANVHTTGTYIINAATRV